MADSKPPTRSVRSEQRVPVPEPTVAVVGGDEACVRALVRRWTGQPAAKVLRDRDAVRLHDVGHRRAILVMHQSTVPLQPWPGGPLVWLFPERGPSELELAVLRQVLATNATNCPALRVLLCLPFDVAPEVAVKDLEVITETLRWALEPQVEMEIEVAWLSDVPDPSLAAWLDNLR